LEIAKNDRQSISIRKSSDLFVNRRVIEAGIYRPGLGHPLSSLSLADATSTGIDPYSDADTSGYAEQPTRQGVTASDRARPPCQNEKRRLKSVLYVVWIIKGLAAYSDNHSTMSCYNRFKGYPRDIIRPDLDAIQELCIGQSGTHPRMVNGPDCPYQRSIPDARHLSVLFDSSTLP
jgi:hypothetical protein